MIFCGKKSRLGSEIRVLFSSVVASFFGLSSLSLAGSFKVTKFWTATRGYPAALEYKDIPFFTCFPWEEYSAKISAGVSVRAEDSIGHILQEQANHRGTTCCSFPLASAEKLYQKPVSTLGLVCQINAADRVPPTAKDYAPGTGRKKGAVLTSKQTGGPLP